MGDDAIIAAHDFQCEICDELFRVKVWHCRGCCGHHGFDRRQCNNCYTGQRPDTLAIDSIVVGERHRQDMGDLDGLARSIATEGLLQPIGITEDFELVFGERRLRACHILGLTEVDVRFVSVSSIVAGEFHENEVRKDFTPSERVAIERTINAQIDRHAGGRGNKLDQDFGRVSKPDDVSAKLAGFGNRETARQARKVVDQGTPELIDAMDAGKVSISAAAEIADQPAEEQRARLNLPSPKEALEESKRTGAAVLGRDNKYHAHVEPDDAARTDLWFRVKGAIWSLSDLDEDPAAAVAAVPFYQAAEFDRRLHQAAEILNALIAERTGGNVDIAAE